MTFKKAFKSFMMMGILLSPLCAGEVTVKNDATVTISVTIRGMENKSPNSPFTLIRNVKPGKDITVTLDEKEFEGVTFSIQGTTVTALGIIPLTSNECVLSGCEGEVKFVNKADGSALVCGVTHVGR